MNKKAVIIGGLGGVVVAVAVIAYMSGSKAEQVIVDQNDPKVIANGQELYGRFCASCHGKDLQGQPNWQSTKADGTLPAPPHDKTGHTWHHGDNVLFGYIKGGGASLGIEGFKSGMPPFKSMLNDTKIWSVLAYIKSQWPDKYRARQAAATELEKQQQK